MCGIVGLSLQSPCSSLLYESLSTLQHRGQDACGLLTLNNSRFYQTKKKGLVKDIPDAELASLKGNCGIGHVRYPTSGDNSINLVQPLYVNSPFGLAIAHNGNLVNTREIKSLIGKSRHINTDSDTELLLNLFASFLSDEDPSEENVVSAIKKINEICKGGYACVLLIAGFGLVGFRDPWAIRPLCYGMNDTNDFGIASESVALSLLGFKMIKDIGPGQVVIRKLDNRLSMHSTVAFSYTPCLFEYIYFSRPDSVMDGISVYKARLSMGEKMACRIKSKLSDILKDIEVIIPVPDTSRVSALQVAQNLEIPYREGFIKNRYIGRTFIMPGQTLRVKAVRRKLSPIISEFEGKNVLLVDDSVVRGTTSKEIINMARECGAKKVYFASCAPEIK
eukprot:NODE_2_length_91304_cov_0.692462.p21 type:complete len:392 gc:universal NODE_2_length_91304_cov_0.692462:34949-33774(-)